MTVLLEDKQRGTRFEQDTNIEEINGFEADSKQSPIDNETQNRYRYWKKNTPFLYDYLVTHPLVWPSLTVQFFPDLELSNESDVPYKSDTRADEGSAMQRLLVGTFTLGQSIDNISILKFPYYSDLNRDVSVERLDFNQEKEEFELTKLPKKRISVLQKINHLGDVNRARYMPQNPDVLASCNNIGDTVIYDRTKHANFKNLLVGDASSISKPQIRLHGANQAAKDIFALDWNSNKEGIIATGRVDGEINVFDLRKQLRSKEQQDIYADVVYENDGFGINDIKWMPQHDSMLIFADEKGAIQMHDTRIKESDRVIFAHKSSEVGVNSISVNPVNSYFLASGDSNGRIEVWDIRKFGSPTCSSIITILELHSSPITQLKWHNRYHNILASSSNDLLVKIFGLDREENEGLIFNHGGHMLGVNDFDWSLHDDWMIASVSDDNSLQVWKPSQSIVQSYMTS